MRSQTRAGLITLGATFILVFPAAGVKALDRDALALPVAAVRPDPTPPPPPPPEPEELEAWDNVLRNLLHYICAVIKCYEARETTDADVASFIAAYHAHGVNPELSQAQRASALSAVVGTMDHVASDPGVLASGQRDELLDVLDQIANDLRK